MSKVNYYWWPISFGWVRDSQTLAQWVRRAIDSRKWTLDYPHRYMCSGALEIHKAACLRMWHGWPIGASATEYGWTLHLGRFKVYFGVRKVQNAEPLTTCGATRRPDYVAPTERRRHGWLDVLSSIVMMAGLIAFAIWSMWFSGFAI